MASAFTHVFVAGALAQLSQGGHPPRSGARGAPARLRLALVLSLLAVLPDADVLAFRFGIAYEHPLGHRGLTHSIPFALLCGALTPWLVCLPERVSGARWWKLAALGFVATLSHGVLDAMTNGGLGVGFLVPLSSERFFLPWRPLLVSPLSASAFFSPSGLAILMSEIAWVWLPVTALLVASAGVRARLRRAHRHPAG